MYNIRLHDGPQLIRYKELDLDVIGVYDLAFRGPNSVIISDSCDYVGTYVGILITFCLPRIFE